MIKNCYLLWFMYFYNTIAPSEDDVTVSVDVYNLENNLTQIILSIAVSCCSVLLYSTSFN